MPINFDWVEDVDSQERNGSVIATDHSAVHDPGSPDHCNCLTHSITIFQRGILRQRQVFILKKIVLLFWIVFLSVTIINFSSDCLRFVSTNSALYEIVTKTPWNELLQSFFFVAFSCFLIFVCIGLIIMLLREMKIVNSKWYNRLFRWLFLLLFASVPSLALASILPSDLFQLATTVISFVALASPLVRKTFLVDSKDTKTTHEKSEHSKEPLD